MMTGAITRDSQFNWSWRSFLWTPPPETWVQWPSWPAVELLYWKETKFNVRTHVCCLMREKWEIALLAEDICHLRGHHLLPCELLNTDGPWVFWFFYLYVPHELNEFTSGLFTLKFWQEEHQHCFFLSKSIF